MALNFGHSMRTSHVVGAGGLCHVPVGQEPIFVQHMRAKQVYISFCTQGERWLAQLGNDDWLIASIYRPHKSKGENTQLR